MGIFSVFIINKAGGLIFQYDHYSQRPEVEKTFSFPIELVLKQQDEKLVVAFGERDGIKGVYSVFLSCLSLSLQCLLTMHLETTLWKGMQMLYKQ